MLLTRASQEAQPVSGSPAMQETRVQSLGRDDPLGVGTGNPLQYSLPENPMDTGAWRAAVRGVAKRQTRLRVRARRGTKAAPAAAPQHRPAARSPCTALCSPSHHGLQNVPSPQADALLSPRPHPGPHRPLPSVQLTPLGPRAALPWACPLHRHRVLRTHSRRSFLGQVSFLRRRAALTSSPRCSLRHPEGKRRGR